MKKFAILIALIFPSYLIACTNFIVPKGASRDGSTFLAYTNDAEYLYNLHKTLAKRKHHFSSYALLYMLFCVI